MSLTDGTAWENEPRANIRDVMMPGMERKPLRDYAEHVTNLAAALAKEVTENCINKPVSFTLKRIDNGEWAEVKISSPAYGRAKVEIEFIVSS